ncbi:MAG: hypothetical protein OK452_08780, partial [Thaumarchaeota archaeon]|nr:hypothetical protein [Nitrososphaerota archaeon]
MAASNAPENHEAQTRSSRRNGLLFVASVTSIVLILLAGSSGYFAIFFEPPSYPTSPNTIKQQQLTITTGIISWTTPDGSHHYQWDTSLRATSKANVVSIKAILNITRSLPPVVQTVFGVGFGLIGPNDPLNHNQTTGSEVTDLTPAYQNFLHLGQSFPESVMVTFS